MAPIRRYLRITKYSVLECRIYLDNPVLAESWLLNPRDPVLPRVIEAVRPLVLPKLREEDERRKAKGGGKKKGVKDVVVEEDFEISIFLTETSNRHTILSKQKTFRDPNKQGIQSNSQKLMGATNDTAINVEEGEFAVIREESEDGGIDLAVVPDADVDAEEVQSDSNNSDSLFIAEDAGPRRSKRSRAPPNPESVPSSLPELEPSSKRRKDGEENTDEEVTDDKKKMAMDTLYDGFSIYGRVLCLVVKRRDKKGKAPVVTGGQAMMEDWISSTQMPAQEED